MKALIIMLLAMLVGYSARSAEVTVTNPTNTLRSGEIVEVEVASLGFPKGATLVVFNGEGVEIPSQITYDGKLIFCADVNGAATATYTVKNGKPSNYQTYACGKVYPERVDDLAWESNLIAYRIYGPALQASGERAFGNDVWLKNNTELPVVEARYAMELNPETRAKIAELRKTDKKAARALAASVSYHHDHGNGFDPYKVGPTLGAGATALLDKNSIIYPYCYSKCEILDNGPLRFTAKMTYRPTAIGKKCATETRTISIDYGSFLNKTTVCYNGSKGKYKAMSGIVLHEESPRTTYNAKQGYVTYAERVKPAKAGELYLAMYFPEGWDGAENRFWNKNDEMPKGTYGHAAVYNTLKEGETLTYWWGGLWNKVTAVDVKTKEVFDALVAKTVANKKSPLQVRVTIK